MAVFCELNEKVAGEWGLFGWVLLLGGGVGVLEVTVSVCCKWFVRGHVGVVLV